MKSFFKLFLSCDIFSFNPDLCFNGEYRYRSVVGVIISLIFYCTVISLGTLLFKNYIDGVGMSVIQSEFYGYDNEIQLSDNLLMVRIINESSLPVPTSIIKPFVSYNYYMNNSNDVFVYEMKRCEEKDFENALKHIAPDINSYFCLNTSSMKYKSIKYSDKLPLQSYLGIYAAFCDSSTYFNNENCSSPEEQEKYKKNNVLVFEYILKDDYANHKNNINPIQKSYKTKTKYINNGLSYLSITLQKIFYSSDEGFIFIRNKNYEGLKTGEVTESFQEKGISSYYIGNVHFYLEILPSILSAIQYNRSYPKLQSILASIGGIFNAIMFLCQFIAFFFTRGLFFRDLTLLYFNNTYYNNKIKVTDEFITLNKTKLISHKINIKKKQLKNKENMNNIENKNIKIYSDYNYSGFPLNNKNIRFSSTFNINYKSQILTKENDENKNEKNNMILNSKNFIFNKNNRNNSLKIPFELKEIKKINFITYLKSLIFGCYQTKNGLVLEKLQNIICLFLSSDELVFNYMRNRILNEFICKTDDNLS